jgi:RNA polymerase sigma factor (TIGR02999 family)
MLDEHTMITVDALITSADHGDRSAADALFDALYSELHSLASRELARQHGGPASLGATTLLHQAYVAMAERDGAIFPDRARFMAYAARVMRGLIIDNLRYRHAEKRGGDVLITALDTDVADQVEDVRQLTLVSEALDELATHDAALAEIVDLKFFCGFSFAEIAEMRGVSERTIQRNWEKGRLYLHHAIGGGTRSLPM